MRIKKVTLKKLHLRHFTVSRIKNIQNIKGGSVEVYCPGLTMHPHCYTGIGCPADDGIG